MSYESRPPEVSENSRKSLFASIHSAGFSPTLRQATLAVLVLGLLWRVVRYAVAFPLWGDEAFLAVNFLTRDLAGLGRPLDFKQVAPPAFLWVEYLVVQVLGSSEWSLRLVPFAAGIASLVLFHRFCRDVSTRRVTLLAVALLAASYFPVRHSTEVKPYANDLLVSLLLLGFGWSLQRDPRPLGRWFLMTLVGVVGVWWSYPATFPVAAVGVVLFASGWRAGSRRTVGLSAVFSVAAGLSWLLMMLTFARAQQGERGWLAANWESGFPPLDRPWKLPLWLLEVHTSGMVAYPHGASRFTGVGTALFVGVGVAAVWRHRLRRPLLLLLLGPLPFALAAAVMRRYPYGASTRLMLYMAPAVCLLAAEGMVATLRYWHSLRRGPFLTAGLLALIPIGGIVVDVCMPYRRAGDVEYRRFAERLALETRPGDRWVVFDGVDTLPDGPWVMASVWVQRVAKLRFYLLSRSPVPVCWGPDPGTVDGSNGGRTWLILHDHGQAGLYPTGLRAVFEHTARTRLGTPRSSRIVLPVGSVVDLHTFEPPQTDPAARLAAARRSADVRR